MMFLCKFVDFFVNSRHMSSIIEKFIQKNRLISKCHNYNTEQFNSLLMNRKVNSVNIVWDNFYDDDTEDSLALIHLIRYRFYRLATIVRLTGASRKHAMKIRATIICNTFF